MDFRRWRQRPVLRDRKRGDTGYAIELSLWVPAGGSRRGRMLVARRMQLVPVAPELLTVLF